MQERRRGPESNLWGARLPAGPRPGDPDEGLADPAGGEKVLRCLTCSAPETTQKLLEFGLVLLPGKRIVGGYRLCGRCFRYAQGYPSADPLDVTDRT